MTEELLAARRESQFPTNAGGPDEDVNVYLAHLLTSHLRLDATDPALAGRPANSRHATSEAWRREGDRRLLALGLYGHGDPGRRRRVPLGWSEDEARRRDLADGRTSYELAAARAPRALAPVLRKLALGFAGYVHVLEVLARSRFGLGARLSAAALRELTATTEPPAARRPSGEDIDTYLDCLLEHGRAPSAATQAALAAAARRAGIRSPG
jgi:hypothetical protein